MIRKISNKKSVWDLSELDFVGVWRISRISWELLATSWALLGRLLDALGCILGASWASWALLGSIWDRFGVDLDRFRVGRFGTIFGRV